MTDDALISRLGLAVDPSALRWKFSRAGGPGGQHVNKTESRVEARLVIAEAGLPEPVAERLVAAHGEELKVIESSSRSQLRNRELATQRLLDLVDSQARPPVKRRATRPGKGAVERRLEAKRHTSTRKAERRRRDED